MQQLKMMLLIHACLIGELVPESQNTMTRTSNGAQAHINSGFHAEPRRKLLQTIINGGMRTQDGAFKYNPKALYLVLAFFRSLHALSLGLSLA